MRTSQSRARYDRSPAVAQGSLSHFPRRAPAARRRDHSQYDAERPAASLDAPRLGDHGAAASDSLGGQGRAGSRFFMEELPSRMLYLLPATETVYLGRNA